VDYFVEGTDNDLRVLAVDDALRFVNPKVGVDYQNRPDLRTYASWSLGHREPSRTDYVDSPEGTVVRPERLQDWELGAQWTGEQAALTANGYFMDYRDQLVLTGDLNDVGSPLRTNVTKSYRLGVELDGRWSPVKGVVWRPNLAWSRNRIQQFDEVIFDYDENQPYRQVVGYQDVPIAFSPSVVATSILAWEAWSEGETSLIAEWALRHVGEQFLDNTGSPDRALPAYTVNDLRLRCSWARERDVLSLNVFVNNVLGVDYSANGWAYSYQYGGPDSRVSEVYVYPQAGRFVTVGLDWSWR
jgi:iron complex outermembrane receptor protein